MGDLVKATMALGTKVDYDQSIHDPVEMTFAELQEKVALLDVTKAGTLNNLKELYVVLVALRQWEQAMQTMAMIGLIQGHFPSGTGLGGGVVGG